MIARELKMAAGERGDGLGLLSEGVDTSMMNCRGDN